MNARRALVLMLLAPIAAPLAACGAPRRRAAYGGTLDDATITVAVKTALLNDPAIGALKIDVQTSQGVVTLSGSVKTRDEEAAAIGLARKVEGVRDVKSELKIEP